MKALLQSPKWWKEMVVYQVYPRSFMDSNGDGIGDLNGITSKLDYLKYLGIGAIWMSPVYKSPNDDNGYDISDYQDIMDEFGTFRDWENLVSEAHKRDIKIVMDLVLNHTSYQHKWFQEARKSKDNPYRDYYIWRDPKLTDKEPNNWISMFGGSAWEKDDLTNQYYLHLFTRQQPDLNWENPQVRRELHDMVEFWCKKGVDGFRMDVINVISKTPALPDAPVKNENDMYHWAGEHFFNGPRFVEWMQEMKTQVFEKYNIYTVGETPNVTADLAKEFTKEAGGVLNMLFHFELMEVDIVPGETKWESQPWKLKDIKSIMSQWQTNLNDVGWNSLYLENHDQPRSLSRFGNDSTEQLRVLSGKMLSTFLFMLKGTVYIYQGQEIGMTNVQFPSIQDYRDVESHNFWNHHKSKGDKTDYDMINAIWTKGRDNTRTPMQWTSQQNAGFSTAEETWIKVNPNYETINVESALSDPNSIFHYYRHLIQLRKDYPIIIHGAYRLLQAENPLLYVFTRTLGYANEQMLTIVNFFNQEVILELTEKDKTGIIEFHSMSVLISNYDVDREENFMKPMKLKPMKMRPYEARVYHLRGSSVLDE
jgi:oligo-1,6-glucosidase